MGKLDIYKLQLLILRLNIIRMLLLGSHDQKIELIKKDVI